MPGSRRELPEIPGANRSEKKTVLSTPGRHLDKLGIWKAGIQGSLQIQIYIMRIRHAQTFGMVRIGNKEYSDN